MGLVWRPLNKPKEGKEEEFKKLFTALNSKQAIEAGVEELLGKFLRISTAPYETLNAPMVGRDREATQWAKSKFELRPDKALPLEAFMAAMENFYVIELLERHDGIPVYVGGADEPHVFGATFLKDCEVVAGEEILDEAYTSKLAEDAFDYGTRLMEKADVYAKENNLEYLKDVIMPPDEDEETPISKTHIVYSAAKWLLWWSSRGHGYEANF